MKKILNTLLIAAVTGLAVPQIANATTEQNSSVESPTNKAKAAAVTTKVKTALMGKDGIKSNDISVETTAVINKNNKKNVKYMVLLTGTQDNDAAIKLAGETAKSADKDIATVNNKLELPKDKN